MMMRRERETGSSGERARASIASRPAREERRCGLSTRSSSVRRLRLTPATLPTTSAGRLADDAALYATSVRRQWDQQCLSRFRSRSALRLVITTTCTCPECHLGAHRHIHAQTHIQRYTNVQTSLLIRSISIFICVFLSFSLAIFLSLITYLSLTRSHRYVKSLPRITTGMCHPLIAHRHCRYDWTSVYTTVLRSPFLSIAFTQQENLIKRD